MQDWPTSLQQLVQAFGLRPVSGQAAVAMPRNDGQLPGSMPVDTSAESSWEYLERTKPTQGKESLREFVDRWNKWNAGLINGIVGDVAPLGYRTEGRRRSDNVIDARWDVPGETPEQKSTRLWAAHDRGVGLARTMIPTIVSRNPALEGQKAEPLFFEGSDRLIPTAADLERIMAGARRR